MNHTSGPSGTGRGKQRRPASKLPQETVEQTQVLDWSIDEESLLEPDWIWQRWLPRGRVTVLGTPSGSDFSGLVADLVVADLVARVTAGTSFPGLGPPTGLYCRQFAERVAVVTAGGDPRRDFGRLVALAGGRLDQLHLTSGVVEPAGPDGYPTERPFNLPADFPLLRQWQFEENLPPAHLTIPRSPEHEPVSLLVIEALPRQVSKWRESELRTLLDQLNRLAFERHMAILLVTPLTVLPARLSAGKVTLAKAFGSSMLVESVGALWHIDQDLSHPDRFDLICHKLCQRRPSVAFSLNENGIQWEIADWQDPRTLSPILKPAAATATVVPVVSELPAMAAVPTSVATSTLAAAATVPPLAPPSSHQTPRQNSSAIPKRKQAPPQNPQRDPATWPEAKTQRERESRVAPVGESTTPRPAVDGSPPIRKTEDELRQTPEWKRASRNERKRLLRNARSGIVSD
ncbi:MAG: hypothetical protein NT069_30635 [Planctomycetota bacterium]|nr:hypothetical protein [Planctomycetota bacterium]